MEYTTNLIKSEWYEPLYNEVLQVCDYMMDYTNRHSEAAKFLTGEDLSIGNNTTVFIGVCKKSENPYIHISVHSTYPYMLRYIILKCIQDHKIKFIVDKNNILDNEIQYGQYWYEDWKSSKPPMWVNLQSIRRYIEQALIDQYGQDYISQMDLEEYIKLETNHLLMLSKEKKYIPIYDTVNTLFNIRNTEYEKYHPKSFPISNM